MHGHKRGYGYKYDTATQAIFEKLELDTANLTWIQHGYGTSNEVSMHPRLVHTILNNLVFIVMTKNCEKMFFQLKCHL